MRFSDTFLRQVRDRVSLADYAGRKLVFDRRKSRPAAGDYWACCPFHEEKSASFHVLDSKGIYKCFGCGEKGDLFTLAMKLEGLSFPEVVAKMADIAGMALPEDEHEDRGAAEHRKRLYAVAARTAKLYADALRSPLGAEARAYLEKRGLGPDEWVRFGIGWAPAGWTWTIDKLRAEGFTFEEIIACGIARDSDDGRRPIDTFRARVTFEIADSGGKVIAFGGRTLQKDEKAKYINSPECALYSKGRVLYRLKQARELAAKSKAAGLVVGEGYLDVIAFERAGIGAVAPCGTALTEDQLQLLWRAGAEPILCFDGDAAGKRAAERALDLALPHLGPGKTVRIAVLPAGEDPDDVYRRAGPEALTALLDNAAAASDALFEREKSRKPLTTPEARAAFKTALREAAMKIADAETRKLYLSDLLARADAALRPPPRPPGQYPAQGQRPGPQGGWGRFKPPEGATPELIAKYAARLPASTAEQFLRAAIDYPGVLVRFGELVDRLELGDRDLAAIRAVLQEMGSHAAPETIDREGLKRHLLRSGEDRAAARVAAWPKPRAAGRGGSAPEGDVEAEWLALVTREVVLPAINEELAELRPLAEAGDEAAFARFQGLSREAREIERRAREAKLDEPSDEMRSGDLVAHQ